MGPGTSGDVRLHSGRGRGLAISPWTVTGSRFFFLTCGVPLPNIY